MKGIHSLWLLLLLLTIGLSPAAQPPAGATKALPAGAQYNRNRAYTFLWGSGWRTEWATPVQLATLNIDSAYGGLQPDQTSAQPPKTLRLISKTGRHYWLNRVDKAGTSLVPEMARGTIADAVTADLTAASHPFAGQVVAALAEAAGVYHSNPLYFFVPEQKALGMHNAEFANTICWLEERPDNTQLANPNFGQPQELINTETMLWKASADSRYQVDQQWYVKTILFELLIGDGQPTDHRWAVFDSGDRKLIRAVHTKGAPTWARFDGLLTGVAIGATGHRELQRFGPKIKDIQAYNYTSFALDHRLAAGADKALWQAAAEELQRRLTDEVIDKAVAQLPIELAVRNAPEIINTIKQRRDDLLKYALDYYALLAGVADVTGSAGNEHFVIDRLADSTTVVTVSDARQQPFYSRVFRPGETDEIRLYGLSGNDRFTLLGSAANGIRLRVIGGEGTDTLQSPVAVGASKKIDFYDNPQSIILNESSANIHLSADTGINNYNWQTTRFPSQGFKKVAAFNPFYRYFIGVHYNVVKHGWRKEPYKRRQTAGLDYSLTENSFHPFYEIHIPQVVGKWGLRFRGGFDAARRTNYYGTGNNTLITNDTRRFNWLRTRNGYAALGLERPSGQKGSLFFGGAYSAVEVLDNSNRFVSKQRNTVDASTFNWKYFATAAAGYRVALLNSRIMPTKGITVSVLLTHTRNLANSRAFTNAELVTAFYVPLSGRFSVFVKTGGAAISGQPEFYQLNTVGGGATLRGFQRDRFYGKTIFYNQNEIRYLAPFNSFLFKGHAGLLAMYDAGRVWQPGEASDTWHTSIGGGFTLVPFDKISASVIYAVSNEDGRIHFRIGREF